MSIPVIVKQAYLKAALLFPVISLLFISASWAESSEVVNYKMKRGDTLASILYSVGIDKSSALAQKIYKATDQKMSKYLIYDRYVSLEIEGPYLKSLEFKLSPIKSLVVNVSKASMGNDFVISHQEVEKETHKKIVYYSGVITKKNNSLYKASKSSSKKYLTNDVIDNMAEILGWKIDFNTEVRVGDEFKVIYEEVYYKSKKLYGGDILALEYLHNQSDPRNARPLYAFRYKYNNKVAYFDQDGKSVQKAYLRYPVTFSRISSRFKSRYHPILKKWKAHRGVDFAAPRGTPIFSAGDGRVTEVKFAKGYGRMITIQHRNNVKSRYAHLNTFAKGIRPGKYVTKKEVIGYVGSSGYATGPHLHYEWIKNGKKVNPLKVKIPSVHPVARQNKKEFLCLASYWKEMFSTSFVIEPIIVSRTPASCEVSTYAMSF